MDGHHKRLGLISRVESVLVTCTDSGWCVPAIGRITWEITRGQDVGKCKSVGEEEEDPKSTEDVVYESEFGSNVRFEWLTVILGLH